MCLALAALSCAGVPVTPSTVLTEVNKTIDALIAAYTAFCGGLERAQTPQCAWLAEQLGTTIQRRGQLTVAVQGEGEAKP